MPDIFIDNTAEEKKTETPTEVKTDPEKPAHSAIEAKKEELEKGIPALKDDKVHHHLHLFASYCEKPHSVKYPNLLENEEIILFLRRHFVTNVPWVIKAILFGTIPVIFSIINSFGFFDINDFLPSSYTFLLTVFYYFVIFGYIFVSYITWFYNISLVTNIRIVDIDFSQIVFENVDATKLSQVEDVGYVQVGVIRSIFDYGDVHLHTAGPASNFEFLAVPHPERVVKIINGLIGEAHNA